MEIQNLLDIPEVATARKMGKRIGAAPSTLYRAYYAGELRGSKVGPRSLLFTRSDVLEWLGLQAISEPAPAPVQTPKTVERLVASRR